MKHTTIFSLTCFAISVAGLSCIAAEPANPKTSVSIVGEDFYINGKPTYAGRKWNGHRIEGLLLNSRMVQATYDDLNPETAQRWAYADTGKWDAERNVREFIAAMPEWKAHGLLAVTVNFQGGSPEGYSGKQTWESGAFTAEGDLRPEFAARMHRVLDAADAQGMVVILGYFYFGQSPRLSGDDAAIHATDVATRWLLDGGWRNVLVEINNESNPGYKPRILRPDRVSELMIKCDDVGDNIRDALGAYRRRLLVRDRVPLWQGLGGDVDDPSEPGWTDRSSDLALLHAGHRHARRARPERWRSREPGELDDLPGRPRRRPGQPVLRRHDTVRGDHRAATEWTSAGDHRRHHAAHQPRDDLPAAAAAGTDRCRAVDRQRHQPEARLHRHRPRLQ